MQQFFASLKHRIAPRAKPRSRWPLGRGESRGRSFESLEVRWALDGGGILAGDDRYLSLSFAADGTDIAGHISDLFTKLDQAFQRDAWQETILRGFQEWTAEMRLDVGLVEEVGAYPLGTPGANSADPRFGDIRIGARPLANNVLAVSIPSDTLVSGTWAADVIFNSDAEISSLDDLYSLALHEAGHVFGLQHSDDPLSPMNVHGVSTAIVPTAADIATLQGLHGQRMDDPWEGQNRNETLATAADLDEIELVDEQDGGGPSMAFAAISTPTDVDFYRLKAIGDYTGPVTIQLRTAGTSLLTPEFSVFDRGGSLLYHSQANSPLANDLSYSIPTVDSNDDLYIRVGSSVDSLFAVGNYALIATFDNTLSATAEQIDEVARTRLVAPSKDEIEALFAIDGLVNDDRHTDDEVDEAQELEARLDRADSVRHIVRGSIADAADQDVYKIKTPDLPGGIWFASVAIRSLDTGRLVPAVELLDKDAGPLAATILVNGGGELIVQSGAIDPSTEFFVRVAGDETAELATGNYQLVVSFSTRATELEPFFVGSMDTAQDQVVQQLHVAVPQLFHFVLTVDSAQDSAHEAVMLRVLDAAGHELTQLTARPGESRTGYSLLLMPGTYDFQALRLNAGGQAGRLDFHLDGLVISDPFAVDPEQPSGLEFLCPGLEGVYCYPGGVMSDSPFLWIFWPDAELPLPTLSDAELQSVLQGDWWQWYWQSTGSGEAPQANHDRYQVTTDSVLRVDANQGVLSNDADPEGDRLMAILRSSTAHGRLQFYADGSFDYQPELNFTGTDQFTYQAFDYQTLASIATVTIEVRGGLVLLGDFTNDGSVNQQDLDVLAAGIQAGTDLRFDLNHDLVLDSMDWAHMVQVVMHTSFGDSNLDGVFDSGDLVFVFQTGAYELGDDGSATWISGDWNGDGRFDTADLVFAFQQGGYVAAGRAAEARVSSSTVASAMAKTVRDHGSD